MSFKIHKLTLNVWLDRLTFTEFLLFFQKNVSILPIWTDELTFLLWQTSVTSCKAGMVGVAPKWVRLAPNGTNPGLFQIRFQCIWRRGAKCTEMWSEKVPDLSDLTHFGAKPTIPASSLSHDVKLAPKIGQIWEFFRTNFSTFWLNLSTMWLILRKHEWFDLLWFIILTTRWQQLLNSDLWAWLIRTDQVTCLTLDCLFIHCDRWASLLWRRAVDKDHHSYPSNLSSQ